MNKKDENKKDENENDESERYEYCWEGCYDEETDWIVKTEIRIIEGEEYVHCPNCGRVWYMDHVQIKMYPKNIRQRGISSQYEG